MVSVRVAKKKQGEGTKEKQRKEKWWWENNTSSESGYYSKAIKEVSQFSVHRVVEHRKGSP